MQIDLSAKTAIVTGSSAGIGLATATGLARCGARVVVNARTDASVQRALAAIGRDVPGARVEGFAADLGGAEGCDALVAAHPSTDILVNCLGIFEPRDFFETSDQDWRRFFEVNVLSGVRLARAYLPAMQKCRWGRVVFVASESAFNLPTAMIHYGVTKTAQVALARGLAKRMAGTGVTVNSVLPGPTLSHGMATMLAAEVAKTGDTLEEVARRFVLANRPSSILRRATSVEEVANMIVYVCSSQASATTGAALRVDGGVIDSL